MSVWKNGPDGRTRRRNKIATQFAWQSIDALESPAYRALSLSGHRVLARIQIEHARHGGRENGRLPVTFQNFEDYGIHRHAIAPAIREGEALGFIRITQLGRAGNGEFRIPNKFALTHLPTENGQVAATDDWRRIKTPEEAMAVAEAARKAPARFGKISRRRAAQENRIPVAETAPQSVVETALQHPKYQWRKPHYCHRQKPHYYLYLGEVPIPLPCLLAQPSLPVLPSPTIEPG